MWTEKSGLQFVEPSAETTYAYDVDEQNRVAGLILIAGSYQAILWDDGVTINLAKELNLKGNSAGRYIDAQGRVLISEFVDGITRFQWYDSSNTSQVDIHEFPSGSYTLRAIASENGRVAFSWSSPTLGPQLARWSDENGFEYATLDKNIVGISAMAIGLDGTVACTALTLPFYGSIAMIWPNESEPISLHWQIPDSPITSSVITMNEDGQLLVMGDARHWMLEQICVADLDNNGFRDVADILTLIGAWGQTDQGQCGMDLDGSGVVDVSDLLIIVGSWGPCE